MAALLTVERHDTEKVGVLIAECRRMGIEVLPPNVNVSGHNFTIEQLPPDRPAPHRAAAFPFPVPERTAIRMGLDAIKNVGEGPDRRDPEARAATARSPPWPSSPTASICARSTAAGWSA